MTESESPQAGDVDEELDEATNGRTRPHALDLGAEEWDEPKPTIFTLRNVIGTAATLFVSLMLALHGLYFHSPGAAAGVFFATAILFGPLWFTLANQRYEDRFQNWNSYVPLKKGSRESGREPTVEDRSIEPEFVAVPVVSENASSPANAEVAPVVEPNVEANGREMASYYTPLDARRETTDDRRLSAVANGIVVIFGFYVAAMLIGAPFLTAIILLAWG